MIHQDRILDLIDDIKADTEFQQPWKNKTVSKLQEALAFSNMGTLSTSNQKPFLDPSTQRTGASLAKGGDCICPRGVIVSHCPAKVHTGALQG